MAELIHPSTNAYFIFSSKSGPGNRRSGNVINNQRYFMGGRKERFRCGEGVRPQLNQATIMVWFLRALLESQRTITQLVVFFSFLFFLLFLLPPTIHSGRLATLFSQCTLSFFFSWAQYLFLSRGPPRFATLICPSVEGVLNNFILTTPFPEYECVSPREFILPASLPFFACFYNK